VRIIAASNIDFPAQISGGRFRQDLYFRLARFTITVPPLRERGDDVPLLVRHFLGVFSREMKLPLPRVNEAALEAILAYDFPGNVRELKNVVEGSIIRSGGGEIHPQHLQFLRRAPVAMLPPPPAPGVQAVRGDHEAGIIEFIRERGSINNLQCRQHLGVGRDRASYLLKKMCAEGRLRREGDGRWAEYALPER
jgi:DNA-binding NtrC family response regulator